MAYKNWPLFYIVLDVFLLDSQQVSVYLLVSNNYNFGIHLYVLIYLRAIICHLFPALKQNLGGGGTNTCDGKADNKHTDRYQPFKDEAYLFYIRTQCVPRCKHSPLRL
jgi:hypothetical protein